MMDVLIALRKMESRLAKQAGGVTIRSMEAEEPLPPLPHGLPDIACIQREWIWLAEREGLPLAMLVAAPVHNLVFLSRLVSSREQKDCANAAILVPLFRKALADMALRGYTGYVVCLGSRPEEQRLVRIAKHAGAKIIDQCTMLTGPTENKW